MEQIKTNKCFRFPSNNLKNAQDFWTKPFIINICRAQNKCARFVTIYQKMKSI